MKFSWFKGRAKSQPTAAKLPSAQDLTLLHRKLEEAAKDEFLSWLEQCRYKLELKEMREHLDHEVLSLSHLVGRRLKEVAAVANTTPNTATNTVTNEGVAAKTQNEDL